MNGKSSLAPLIAGSSAFSGKTCSGAFNSCEGFDIPQLATAVLSK